MTDNFDQSEGRLPRSLRDGRNADADLPFQRQDPVFDEAVPAEAGPHKEPAVADGGPADPTVVNEPVEQPLPAFHSAVFDLEDGRRRLGRGAHAAGEESAPTASVPAAGSAQPFLSGPGADFSYALPQAQAVPASDAAGQSSAAESGEHVSLKQSVQSALQANHPADQEPKFGFIPDPVTLPDPYGEDTAAADPDLRPSRPSLSDEEVPNQPGAILKHAREMLGLSQRDIAVHLRLRVNSINDIENDRLNQPTAAAFVRGHIANYAKLVNIDPKIVVDLYEQNVKALQQQSVINSRNLRLQRRRGSRKNSRFRRRVYLLIFVLIAGALLLHYLYTSPVEKQNHEVVLTAENSSAAGTVQAPAVEGSISIQPNSGGEMNILSSSQPPRRVDPNTRRAEELADALGTNELTTANLKKPAVVDTAEPLLTSPRPAVQSAPQPETAQPAPVATPVAPAAQNNKPQAAQAAAAAPAAQDSQPQPPRPAAAPAAPAAGSAAPAQAQTAVAPASGSLQVVDNQANRREGTITLAPPPKEKPAKPALSSSLKDISSRVRVEGRDGLASLNSAQIAVNDEVFLKVTDQRGKVLASGNYSKGDKVSITGIPPIRIAVTDSARISVSYMGGRLVTPRERQVSFVLPQR